MIPPSLRDPVLRRMLGEGVRPARIAKDIGVSRQAVHQRMARAGLPVPPRLKAEHELKGYPVGVETDFKMRLIALYGEDWRALATKAFGMDPATMRRWWNGHSATVPGVALKHLELLERIEAKRRRQRSYERAYKKSIQRGTEHHGS